MAMASNYTDLAEQLDVCCHTIRDLELYIQTFGIDPNHPAVVARRNQLLTNAFITDTDTYRLLMCCCNTLTELDKLVTVHGLERSDPAVRARERVLQVCNVPLTKVIDSGKMYPYMFDGLIVTYLKR